uniref:Uncharacterized protein n=1 Tax=Oryza barthii TaxID=65489 RepID=A0A0D3H0I4_9ORYZ
MWVPRVPYHEDLVENGDIVRSRAGERRSSNPTWLLPLYCTVLLPFFWSFCLCISGENGQKWERRRRHRHTVGAAAVVAAAEASQGEGNGGRGNMRWLVAVASATTGNMSDGRSGGVGVGVRREQRCMWRCVVGVATLGMAAAAATAGKRGGGGSSRGVGSRWERRRRHQRAATLGTSENLAVKLRDR